MTNEAEQAPQTPAPVPTPPLRLRRLKINRWRNVLPDTELHFGDGIHALLGKNGTGKTTLLRLISMCVRRDFSALESESFDIEYELESGQERVIVSFDHQKTEVTEPGSVPSESSLSLPATNPRSIYRFCVQAIGGAGKRVVVEETQEKRLLNGAEVPRDGYFNPFQPGSVGLSLIAMAVNKEEGASPTGGKALIEYPVSPLHFLREIESRRFDEAEGMLGALEGGPAEAKATSALDMRPFRISLIREPFRLAGGQWVPAEIVTTLISLIPEGHLPQNEIWLSHESFHVLSEFCRLTKFRAAAMAVAFQSRMKHGKLDIFYYANARFFVELSGGDIITHDRLSFGQRRLLAFLYYCACNQDVLVVDELTNGLHHEWIAHCVDELAKRQSFVATQHPLLLDYLPIESAKDAETAFLQCRLVEQDGKQYMTWRNTSPEEAEHFWKSYSSGVQFINEILRTDGLW